MQAHLAMLRCEYCDARVELERAPQQQPPLQQPQAPRQPGPPVHVARPQYSRFAWVVLLLPVSMAAAGAFTAFRIAHVDETTTVTAMPSTPVATPRALTVDTRPAAPTPTPTPLASVHTPSTSPTPAVPHGATKPRSSGGAKPSDGPVIDVEQARKQLEPKIRACMQTAKVHHVLAYMGNAKLGPVAVLPDSRTRVDGTKVALGKTALGRCFDAAGKSVRTSAFKSNYVRLDVRNDGVPDPLGALPSKPNPSAVREVIAGFDDDVKACARKSGVEGRKLALQLTISGATGKLDSVRAGDVPSALQACIEGVYRRASFASVQQTTYQVGYSISL